MILGAPPVLKRGVESMRFLDCSPQFDSVGQRRSGSVGRCNIVFEALQSTKLFEPKPCCCPSGRIVDAYFTFSAGATSRCGLLLTGWFQALCSALATLRHLDSLTIGVIANSVLVVSGPLLHKDVGVLLLSPLDHAGGMPIISGYGTPWKFRGSWPSMHWLNFMASGDIQI